MAAFPIYPIDVKQSSQEPVEDLVVDEWPNGAVRGRSYFTPGRYKWQLTMPALTPAQMAIVKAFYDANRLKDDISYASAFDGIAYFGLAFIAPPKYTRVDGGNWSVTVNLRHAI